MAVTVNISAIKHYMWNKDHVWNPSICACGNKKICGIDKI